MKEITVRIFEKGDKVRFTPVGPTYTIKEGNAVCAWSPWADGMVTLEEIPGHFASYVFIAKDGTEFPLPDNFQPMTNGAEFIYFLD
jgi:hypothetical protein